MPCDFTPLSFGNALDESLDDIWRRMASHEAYCSHKDSCRMQDSEFRKQWIDRIPATGPFPYPVSNFDQAPALYIEDEDEEEAAFQSSLGIKG